MINFFFAKKHIQNVAKCSSVPLPRYYTQLSYVSTRTLYERTRIMNDNSVQEIASILQKMFNTVVRLEKLYEPQISIKSVA